MKAYLNHKYTAYNSHKIQFDKMLLSLCGILVLFSFLILYTASGESLNLVYQHGLRVVLSILILVLVAHIPPKKIIRISPVLYSAGVGLLIAVLLFGKIANGAKRWIDLGPFNFQPSELMKLATPMMVAWFLAKRELPLKIIDITMSLVLIAIPTLLIIKQPDLGTGVLVFGSGFLVLVFAGLQFRYIFGFLFTGLLSTPILWRLLHDYQRERILMFLNPETDPLGSGYHIIQAKIALGAGGLFGRGFLQGTQTSLDYLPERTTDFIFCVIGEEFGFIGVSLVLLIYLGILARGLYLSTLAPDHYSRILASSLIGTLFIYIFVNVGMVTGLLPVVGLPLPFISFGGSALVTITASLGIMISIYSSKPMLTENPGRKY